MLVRGDGSILALVGGLHATDLQLRDVVELLVGFE